MYRNTTPPSPPCRIEEEDGNCVIVAPLPHHPALYGSHVDPPSLRSTRTPVPTLSLPHTAGPQHVQQEQPYLVSTPRHRAPSEASASTSVLSYDDYAERATASVGSNAGGRVASPLLYAVHRRSGSAAAEGNGGLRNSDVRPATPPAEAGEDEHRGGRPPLPPTLSTSQMDKAAGSSAAPEQLQAQLRQRSSSSPAPPPSLVYRAVHGPGTLGPLILVRRQKATTAEAAQTAEAVGLGMVPSSSELVTVQEARSYRDELAALRGRLAATADALRQSERRAEAVAIAKAQELAEERRQEERRRRTQMQGVMDSLRERCAELTAQLEAIKLHGPPPPPPANHHHHDRSATTAVSVTSPASPMQQAEWGKQLQEVELYWRQRLRTAARHWEGELELQGRDRAALQEQAKELTRALEQTQEALRHARSEKYALETELGRLREVPVVVGGGGSGGELVPLTGGRVLDENAKLRLQVREQSRRHEVLLAQLESYAEENTRLQVESERKLKAARAEVERERARNADLVKLYSSQVQSLHQQLNDAVAHRNTAEAKPRLPGG